MILDLFKTGVYYSECDFDLEPIKDYCIQHSYNNPSRDVSNDGGYQSHDIHLNDINVLQPLHNKITQELNVFANSMFLNDQSIDNAWININGHNNSNLSHRHAGVALSGVFYISTPENGGDIVFERPDSSTLEFAWDNQIDRENYNQYNAINWTLPAKENTLYLFPAFLSHRVQSNQNQDLKRISISFNSK
tara:strand:- start:48 stop:620 length:573 start_codon:yes stop_codon:yes gene_type:complete